MKTPDNSITAGMAENPEWKGARPIVFLFHLGQPMPPDTPQAEREAQEIVQHWTIDGHWL